MDCKVIIRSKDRILSRIPRILFSQFFLARCGFILFAVSAQATAQVQFQNTTNSIGGPFHTGESWGASWGHINSDVYPDLFVSNHSMKSSLLLNNGDGTFAEVIDTADLDGQLSTGTNVSGDTHGGAWADFDNDGDQDLFVTRSSRDSTLYLFQNDGSGLFTEDRQTFGTGAIGGARMPMLFDYNSDGRLDLAVSGNEGNDLFRWNSNSFVDQSVATGVAGQCLGGHSLIASDFFPDDLAGQPIKPIYICNTPVQNIITAYDTSTIPFTDVADKFDLIGATPDTLIADFNNDLKMDMFTVRGLRSGSGVGKVSNSRIEAWISKGGGTNHFVSFTFSASSPITLDIAARTVDNPAFVFIGSSGYNPSQLPVTLDPSETQNWGTKFAPEYDRKGVFIEYNDITEEWTITASGGGNAFVGAFLTVDGNGFDNPVTNGLVYMEGSVPPAFTLNNGNRLVNSGSRGIGSVSCGGATAADFDNDMDIDLYLACRTAVENIENRLYLNDGSGSFSLASITGAEGLLGLGINSGAGTAEGVVSADYDVDGFIDLFVTNGNRLFPLIHKDSYTAGGPDQFYRNISNNGNKWVEIDLVGNGIDTNRDAFGAKVIVSANGISQLREQNGQFHRWSHDHKRLHFGLASNETADIEIIWPNGDTDNYANVSSNRLYEATQNGSLTDITPTSNPTPTLSINSISQTEGASVQLTISLSFASTSNVSVNYQTNSQTATSGVDFTPSSGIVEFSPGEVSKIISIATIDDTLVEGDETLTVTLSNATAASISQNTGTISIIDNDTVITVPAVSINNISETEGASAQLTISLSFASASNVSVNYQTNSQTATSGVDFTPSSGIVEFSPGEVSKIISIATIDDTLVEGDETLTVTLSNATAASISQNTGTISIIDDDTDVIGNDCGAPSYATSSSNDKGLYIWQDCSNLNVWTIRANAGGSGAIYEGSLESSSIFTSVMPYSFETTDSITLSNNDKTVDYFMAMGGPWEDGLDFTVLEGAELCLTLNSSGLPIFYGVNSVAVNSPVNLKAITQACSTASSLPTILINDIDVSEGVGAAIITLSLTETTSDNVSISYTTMDQSALAGLDYFSTSGTVNFLPGEISKTLSIPIIEDDVSEMTEEFTLILSNPVNALMPDSEALISISEQSNFNTLACGEPTFSSSTDLGLFIWKDCDDSEKWFFRATAGGGSGIQYNGIITASTAISAVSTFSFEASDSYQLFNADQQLDFSMKMGSVWQDGFEFNIASPTNSCVNVISTRAAPIVVGGANTLVTSPFSLNTLASCQ